MTTPTRRLPAACFHVLLSLGDEPRHGLGIMDEVERATGGAVLLGPGSVYGSLKRLAADRLVRERPTRSDDDPRRRYYEITPAGVRSWEKSRDFYLRSIEDFEGRRGLADA